MIAASSSSGQLQPVSLRPRWQQALADAIKDPVELCTTLGLDPDQLLSPLLQASPFPLRVPRGFVRRMQHGDPRDPLLLQVLPTDAENKPAQGFRLDPVGDLVSRSGTAVLHKYHGRALVVATGACAVHCRYCFRRHFPYGEHSLLASEWQATIETIRADDSIREIILSGGDPLSLNDRRLTELTDALSTIAHVERLRIHTRYPVVLPERVDAGLIKWLSGVRLQKVIVIHANHANEIDQEVRDACRQLAATGAILLNQSVLLADINDSTPALVALSEALMSCAVMPYYLHLLDRVQGAAHFEVNEATALRLHAELLAQLPGYLVPRLVREIPGAASKTPVTFAVQGY